MRTDDFDYYLPPDLIAQEPLPRGESRLLVLHRTTGLIEHRQFGDLPEYLGAGDVLALNDTRVTARRVHALLPDGRTAEVLLLRPTGETGWEALVRPGRRFRLGVEVRLGTAGGSVVKAAVACSTVEGGRILEFRSREDRDAMAAAGSVPLPPYITRPLVDEERYQTVYSSHGGSAAAPTAGLHFSDEMLRSVQERGIELARVTLNVGIDTFRPVRVDSIVDHVMHGEQIAISSHNADVINSRRGRLIAVGTTTVRVLESMANNQGVVSSGAGDTRLFIVPGYQFKSVQGILTNFHLPKSTLIMMISAFAGREAILGAYSEAVRQQYRFYSFGDAMLLI